MDLCVSLLRESFHGWSSVCVFVCVVSGSGFKFGVRIGFRLNPLRLGHLMPVNILTKIVPGFMYVCVRARVCTRLHIALIMHQKKTPRQFVLCSYLSFHLRAVPSNLISHKYVSFELNWNIQTVETAGRSHRGWKSPFLAGGREGSRKLDLWKLFPACFCGFSSAQHRRTFQPRVPFHGRCFILLLDGCSFPFSSETITFFFTQFNYFPHWGTRARGRTRLLLFIHRRWFSCWHALLTTLNYKNIFDTRSKEVTT